MSKDAISIIHKITIIETEEALSALLSDIYETARHRTVRLAFINAHGFNMAWTNPAFAADLLACDHVFRDGSGMKILYKLLGRPAGLNLNGTDLIPRILGNYSGKSIALFGTSEPYLERSATIIASMGGNVVVKIDGFQSIEDYPSAARNIPSDLTILAMGMPKQEAVASALVRQQPQNGGLIVCGGAILDFMGGKVTRAPEIFRKTGMEWVYRLILEPKRLFKRYVLGNGLFLMRAILTMIACKRGQGLENLR